MRDLILLSPEFRKSVDEMRELLTKAEVDAKLTLRYIQESLSGIRRLVNGPAITAPGTFQHPELPSESEEYEEPNVKKVESAVREITDGMKEAGGDTESFRPPKGTVAFSRVK